MKVVLSPSPRVGIEGIPDVLPAPVLESEQYKVKKETLLAIGSWATEKTRISQTVGDQRGEVIARSIFAKAIMAKRSL